MGTACSSEIHRERIRCHVKYISLNPNQTAPIQLLHSLLPNCHSDAAKQRSVTGSTPEVRETEVLTDQAKTAKIAFTTYVQTCDHVAPCQGRP